MNPFEKWLTTELDNDQIRDVAKYGADGGFSGLIWTDGMVETYNEHEEEIWSALSDDTQDTGHNSILEFIATFRRIDMGDSPDTFKALLVWYMAERVARLIVDELDSEEDAA